MPTDIPWYEWVYTIDKDWNVYDSQWFILAQYSDDRWYRMVHLSGKRKRVHRILWCIFISNPHNKKTINHIDGNKSNNKITNLEWCTQKENVQHAVKVLWRDLWYRRWTKSNTAPASKKVYQYSMSWKFIKKRNCARDIYRKLWIDFKLISATCTWEQKSSCWYKRSFIPL